MFNPDTNPSYNFLIVVTFDRDCLGNHINLKYNEVLGIIIINLLLLDIYTELKLYTNKN